MFPRLVYKLSLFIHTFSLTDSHRRLRAWVEAWHPTDPLLVDVSQEHAVFLVQVVLQGVVPVLRLDQAEDTHTHTCNGPTLRFIEQSLLGPAQYWDQLNHD